VSDEAIRFFFFWIASRSLSSGAHSRVPLARNDEDGRTTVMAMIRIEPKLDASSGLYYVEIFHPAEAEQPFVTTEPRYKTAAAAENDVIAIIASRANNSRS
jgi:hypothetical protein